MPSDQLFLLIRSLSPEEKRQFKLYSSKYQRTKGNNYLRLFDAIDRMQEYNEEALRKKFSKEKFVKQLHVTKNYLLNLILQSLTIPHFESSPDAQIKEVILHAEILFKKSLYDHCLKLVQKGREMAKGMERYHLLIELIGIEQRIAIKKYDIEMFRKLSIHGYYENLHAVEVIRNFIELRRLLNSLIVLMEKPFEMLTDEERVKLYEESNHPILRSESQALAADCKILYFNYRRQFYDYIHDYNKAYIIAKKYVDFTFEQDSIQSTEKFSGVMFALSNLIGSQMRVGKFREASATLNRLMEVPARTAHHRLMKNERFHLHRLLFLIRSRRCDEALEVAQETEEFLNRFNEKISRLFSLSIISHLSTLYFYCGNYSKALFWRNKIVNMPEKDVPENLYQFSLLSDLMIHFEMKNHQLVQYKLKSVRRYFTRKKDYHALETTIMRLLAASIYKESPFIQKTFSEFLEPLEKLELQKINFPYFEQFDFITWVKSKTKKVLMKDLMKN